MLDDEKRALVERMAAEARAANTLAIRYGHESEELRTQYETEARTWRSARRMVERGVDAV
jgi:poly-gamma-glutamate capsule biosynthesis protein CapA/YwtB (metallophosphatase superfamily)